MPPSMHLNHLNFSLQMYDMAINVDPRSYKEDLYSINNSRFDLVAFHHGEIKDMKFRTAFLSGKFERMKYYCLYLKWNVPKDYATRTMQMVVNYPAVVAFTECGRP